MAVKCDGLRLLTRQKLKFRIRQFKCWRLIYWYMYLYDIAITGGESRVG